MDPKPKDPKPKEPAAQAKDSKPKEPQPKKPAKVKEPKAVEVARKEPDPPAKRIRGKSSDKALKARRPSLRMRRSPRLTQRCSGS